MGVEAGWRPDPSGAAQERFWDGAEWTEQVRPYAAPEPAGKPSKAPRVLIMLGTLIAFLGVAFSFVAATATTVGRYGTTQSGPTAIDFLLIIAGVIMIIVGVALKVTRR